MGHGQTEGPGINSAYVLGVRVCASCGGEAQLPLFALRSGPSLPDAPSHHMEFKARMNGRLLSDEWSSRPGAPERRLSGPAAFLAYLLLAASPWPPHGSGPAVPPGNHNQRFAKSVARVSERAAARTAISLGQQRWTKRRGGAAAGQTHVVAQGGTRWDKVGCVGGKTD